MSEKKQLNEEELEKVTGGFNNISIENLEDKLNQVVNVRSNSINVDCNVRIIKVNARYGTYNSHFDVYVYAIDEQAYKVLNDQRFTTDIIRLWGCDGLIPEDTGLGYGKRGFRFVFEDGDDVYFYAI